LTSVLALIIAAVAVLDVTASARKPSPCASARASDTAGLIDTAYLDYVKALKSAPSRTSCAITGIAAVVTELCLRAERVVAIAPLRARSLLLGLATAEPVNPDRSCVWKELKGLPAPPKWKWRWR